MENEEKPAAKNLLTGLLEGGDQSVKLITLALVVITGGGNLFATKQAASVTDSELNRAVEEIHQLHAELTASMDRQKQMYQMIEQLAKEKKDGS
jgi:hypothetical protein